MRERQCVCVCVCERERGEWLEQDWNEVAQFPFQNGFFNHCQLLIMEIYSPTLHPNSREEVKKYVNKLNKLGITCLISA